MVLDSFSWRLNDGVGVSTNMEVSQTYAYTCRDQANEP